MCSAKLYSRIFLLVCLSGTVLGSAIPMWEFLSRDEKMNHLYNMFLKQVQDHCSTLTMPDCKKVLLMYGLTNLAKMEEDSLDKMDPYQRGATDIIWESMMKGSNKIPGSSAEKNDLNTAKDHLFESSSNSGNHLGSQEEASSLVHEFLAFQHPPPMGPMMIRLLPDGNPVPGEKDMSAVKDEDAEEFKLMRAQPPFSIEELANGSANDHTSSPQNESQQEHSP